MKTNGWLRLSQCTYKQDTIVHILLFVVFKYLHDCWPFVWQCKDVAFDLLSMLHRALLRSRHAGHLYLARSQLLEHFRRSSFEPAMQISTRGTHSSCPKARSQHASACLGGFHVGRHVAIWVPVDRQHGRGIAVSARSGSLLTLIVSYKQTQTISQSFLDS